MRGYTPKSPTQVTGIGTASTAVLAANSTRQGLIIINTSALTISLGLGVAAELGKGITLAPNAVWNMGQCDFWDGAINAWSSGAGGSLSIQEF